MQTQTELEKTGTAGQGRELQPGHYSILFKKDVFCKYYPDGDDPYWICPMDFRAGETIVQYLTAATGTEITVGWDQGWIEGIKRADVVLTQVEVLLEDADGDTFLFNYVTPYQESEEEKNKRIESEKEAQAPCSDELPF